MIGGRRYRIVGDASARDRDNALALARRLAATVPESSSETRTFYLAPQTDSSSGVIVRVLGSLVDVILEPVKAIPKKYAQFAGVKLRRLVHGALRNYQLKGRSPAVSVMDPLNGYREVPRYQITEPLQLRYPPRFFTAWDRGYAGPRLSHLVKERATLYSGYAREVVQLGLGIGRGSDNPREAHDFYHVKYHFKDPISDGVIFIPNREFDKPIIGAPYESFKPVVVRIQHSGDKPRVLVGDMLYWEEAFDFAPQLKTPLLSRFERWLAYAAILEKQGPPKGEQYPQPDTLVKRPIQVYGGLPIPVPPFEIDTNLDDPNEALEQRIRAGLFMEYKLSGEIVGGRPFCESHGWAFSYTQPMASHVLYHMDRDGFPNAALYHLTFDVRENLVRDLDEIPKPPASFLALLQHWVGKGFLDELAVREKLLRADPGDLRSLFEQAPEDRTYSTLDAAHHLAEAFNQLIVPPNRAKYTGSVEIYSSGPAPLDNPARGMRGNPDVHFKFPTYAKDLACVTGAALSDPHKSSSYRGMVPVSVFETRSGATIVTEFVCAPGDKREQEVDGEEPACWVENYRQVIRSYSAEDPIKDCGTNVLNDYKQNKLVAEEHKERKATFLFISYTISDDLIRPNIGWAHKVHKYMVEYSSVRFNIIQKRAAHIAPLFDREIAFIGYPAHGKSSATKGTEIYPSEAFNPWTAFYNRCFPGYWWVDGAYIECGYTGDLGRCPAYVHERWMFGAYGYPRATVDPRNAFDPHPCMEHTGTEVWSFVCQNIDELYNSTRGLTVHVPPGRSESIPAEMKVMVYALGDLDSTVERVFYDIGEDVSISGWWEEPSPDEYGNVAWIYAYENCSGEKAAIVQTDIASGDYKRFGAATRAPFDTMTSFIGIGVPILPTT